MPLNIPDGYGSVAINYSGSAGTAPYVVTFGVALPTGIDLQDVVDFAFSVWTGAWFEGTFDAFTMENATLTVEAPGGGLGSVVSSLPAVPGDASGDAAAVAMAVLVNKRSGLLGRPGRGRFFIPGLLGESDVDVNGEISNSTVTLYQGIIDTWLATMNAGDDEWELGLNPVILHSDASLAPSAINGMPVSKKVGILRKRLR